ncbi:hypothetical protein Tco_0870779, partial [Tanacetum coccineum]
EGPLAEIPRAEDLQPSPEQLRLPIHRPEDNVVLGETSLSFSLQVVHSRVQRVKGEIMEKRLSLTDVMVPLGEPLSSRSLTGEASTFVIPLLPFLLPLHVSCSRKGISVVVSKLVRSFAQCFCNFICSLPLRSELASVFYMACFIVPVDEVSRTEACAADPDVIVGMPISTRITASAPYVNENGVSPLLDLIIVRCAHNTCDISSS